MTVLVTGAKGQVGRAVIRKLSASGTPAVGLDRSSLDICSQSQVTDCFESEKPDLVINCAAFTAVDRAEEERQRALEVNRDGAGYLARACARRGVALIHLSTDYVFDGLSDHGYREIDPVQPINHYGVSKLAGEKAVAETTALHVILRTSWVYGVDGANFVKRMLELAKERDTLKIVHDQTGTPTSAEDLAAALVTIAGKIRESGAIEWGTYHFSGRGPTTWFGFAEQIFDYAKLHLANVPTLIPVGTEDYPTAAARPRFSVLDCRRIQSTFGIRPRAWVESLEAMMPQLIEDLNKEGVAG